MAPFPINWVECVHILGKDHEIGYVIDELHTYTCRIRTEIQDLLNAMDAKCISYRKPASMFQVSKSTLYLCDTGKLEVGGKQGPPSVLTAADEERLVHCAVHMSHIGYGHTKEQILDVVQALVKKDGRPNPFTNDQPGKKVGSLHEGVTFN